MKPKYSGLYVVAEIKSSHLVTLRDKSTGKLFKNSVHLDRLNIAYVRAPNPGNFFLPRVTTDDKNRQDDQPPNADLIKLNVPTNHEADSSFILNSIAAEQGTESNSLSELDEPSEPVIQRRPKRQIKKPARFQTNESNYNETTSETESTFYKIKRILAQRKRDKPEYLVQFMGEPAQNAVWTTFDQLNPQAQKSVVRRPPPIVD